MFLIKCCLWQFFPLATKKMEWILFQTVCLFLNAVWLPSCCLLLGKHSCKLVHTMCLLRRLLLGGDSKNLSLSLGRYKWCISLQDSGACLFFFFQAPLLHWVTFPSMTHKTQLAWARGALALLSGPHFLSMPWPTGSSHLFLTSGSCMALLMGRNLETVSGLLKYSQIVRLLRGPSPGNRFKILD